MSTPTRIRKSDANENRARGELPPLESGDRLTRLEFERRYEAMPNLKKAELIDGVVYVPSPVRHDGHGRQHSALITWLGVYASSTPGVEISDNATLRLDHDNEPQPDALLRIPDGLGGQSHVDEEGFINGAPELVVEVAASSASYDLHQKLQVYQRHGVREYIVWRVFDAQIDWLTHRSGQFERLESDSSGVIQSEVFPGLRLDTAALLKGDMQAVLATLHVGLASEAHTAFRSGLIAAGKSGPSGRRRS